MTWYERLFAWIARLLTIPPPVPPTPPEPPDPEPIPPDDDDDDDGCVVQDREGLPPDNGFVWKPVADVGSMAAVVLPAAFSACPPNHPKVTVYFGDGQKRQETARWSGSFANGCRMSFRFAHPGSYFGRRVKVVARRADGSNFSWVVKNAAVRFESRYEQD